MIFTTTVRALPEAPACPHCHADGYECSGCGKLVCPECRGSELLSEIGACADCAVGVVFRQRHANEMRQRDEAAALKRLRAVLLSARLVVEMRECSLEMAYARAYGGLDGAVNSFLAAMEAAK